MLPYLFCNQLILTPSLALVLHLVLHSRTSFEMNRLQISAGATTATKTTRNGERRSIVVYGEISHSPNMYNSPWNTKQFGCCDPFFFLVDLTLEWASKVDAELVYSIGVIFGDESARLLIAYIGGRVLFFNGEWVRGTLVYDNALVSP